MCTFPHPEAVRAGHRFVTANLGNPGLCPGTAELEGEVLDMLGTLFHADPSTRGGSFVTGGTEANLTALWTFRNLTGKKELVLPRSAHFSLVKAADILGLRVRWALLDAAGRARTEGVARLLGPRTAAVVAVAGSTELGAVDPVAEIAEICERRGIPLHVDASFGGFILPFLGPEDLNPGPFDFRLPGVWSLGADFHKMGMAPIPSGVLLLKDRSLTKAIEMDSPYLSNPRLPGLLGTRPSFTVAAAYTALTRLGRSGYRRLIRSCLRRTRKLRDGLERLGFSPVCDPFLNILAVRPPTGRLDPLVLSLTRKGWDVSTLPKVGALRLVVMPHVSEKAAQEFLDDVARALK